MTALSRTERREIWIERMRRFSQSSLSVKEFCSTEGVSVPSFYQWKRKLAESTVIAAKFLPIAVKPGNIEPRVLLPGGAIIELPVVIERQPLTELLKAVVQATSMSETQ